MSNEPELKACPCCGSSQIKDQQKGMQPAFKRIVCLRCGLQAPTRKIWNRRPAPPPAVEKPVPWAGLRPFRIRKHPTDSHMRWVVANNGTHACTCHEKEAEMMAAALNGVGQEPE